MRVLNGYFRFVAFLAMILAILAPVAHIAVEAYLGITSGTMPEFDLYRVFPGLTAQAIEFAAGTIWAVILDLVFDIWLWVPVLVVLALVAAAHGLLAAITAR